MGVEHLTRLGTVSEFMLWPYANQLGSDSVGSTRGDIGATAVLIRREAAEGECIMRTFHSALRGMSRVS